MSVARVVVRPVRVVEEGGLVLESHAVEWLKVSVLRLEGNVPPFVICLSGREQKDKTTDPRRHVGELQRPPIVACRDLLCLARTTMSAIRYKPHLTPMCYNLLPPSSLPCPWRQFLAEWPNRRPSTSQQISRGQHPTPPGPLQPARDTFAGRFRAQEMTSTTPAAARLLRHNVATARDSFPLQAMR